MSRIALLLGLTLFGITLFDPPGFATESFQCRHSVTPAMLEEIKIQLPDGNAMADVGRLTATIDALRRKGLPKSRIISQLTGAYCPMVAQDPSLTAAEKAANVRRFSVQVSQLIYSLESGLDVIINVRFTPDVVDAINAKARQQGLSGPAWISMTVENTLRLH